jgi:eukaryotic-like serine/threonine-protein kinase
MDLQQGHKIGEYRVVKCIGRGAMGTVYLCEYPRICGLVAIKVLHPRHFRSDWVVDRFLAEAKVVNQIGHPGIVRIFDCKEDADIGPYLVMEYMQGQTLKERYLDSLPLDPEITSRILLQAASALAVSHRAGIIHRDLKPANLFLCDDPDMPGGERLRLLDFGIAKLLRANSDNRIQTMVGMLPGSPPFMSPEQMVDSNRADARSDIYSLGVIGYQLLTGKYPHQADSIGRLIIMRQEQDPIPPRQLNPEISPALDQVIMTALEREPDCRYQTMDRFRGDLCDAVFSDEEETIVQLHPPNMPSNKVYELTPAHIKRPPRKISPSQRYTPVGSIRPVQPVVPCVPGRSRKASSSMAIIGAAATLLLAAMLIGSYSLF